MKRALPLLAALVLAGHAAVAEPAPELVLPPSSNVPNLEEMRKANEVGVNPEWNADEIGMEIDTYLAEDRGFDILKLFIRQDADAADYVLVRDKLLSEILPALHETNPIGLSFAPIDVTGDGLAEMVVQITCPSACNDGEGCRTLVFSFDDEKAWRILLDVRTQEIGVKRGWDEQPSQLATISENDGVRFYRYEDGRFVSYENVRRTAAEMKASEKSPPVRTTPP